MHNQKRINELLSSIKSCSKDKYLRSEMLPELLALQQELIELVFDGEYAGKMDLRLWNLMKHFEQLNEEKGYIADEELGILKVESNVVTNTIKGLVSGEKGERKTFRSLEMINAKKYLLKNVELRDGEYTTEIDAIVITSKAIFVVEVKNSSKDIYINEYGNFYRCGGKEHYDSNIGEKMNSKEYMLRKVLEESGVDKDRINIVNIVVCTNSKVDFCNQYKYIQTCYLSQLPHVIDDYEGTDLCSIGEMERLSEIIESARYEGYYLMDVDLEKFKRDFAIVISLLEEVQGEKEGDDKQLTKKSEVIDMRCGKVTTNKIDWLSVASVVVVSALTTAMVVGTIKMNK